MVGSGGSDRSKEAVGMMALHDALRSVCLNSDWTYSVFWTIRPRPYVSLSTLFLSICLWFLVFLIFSQTGIFHFCRRVRGGNGCKVGDDNGSLWVWFLFTPFCLVAEKKTVGKRKRKSIFWMNLMTPVVELQLGLVEGGCSFLRSHIVKEFAFTFQFIYLFLDFPTSQTELFCVFLWRHRRKTGEAKKN